MTFGLRSADLCHRRGHIVVALLDGGDLRSIGLGVGIYSLYSLWVYLLTMGTPTHYGNIYRATCCRIAAIPSIAACASCSSARSACT